MGNFRISWHTEDVPDFCTCGAQLPPDARFCHKCGKPQWEEPVALEETPDVAEEILSAAPPPPLPESEPVTLRNRYAVRSALLASLAAFVLLAPLGALGLLALIAGGAFAVFLYHRSTRQPVSVANGARLGWITGLFMFVLLLLMFTASVALEPTFFSDMEKQLMENSTMPQAELQQALQMLRTPLGIGAMVLGMFLSATLPTALGGAISAKFFGRS